MLTLRVADLVGASAVGILLADREGHLRFMAASDEDAKVVEIFQIHNDEGPCLHVSHRQTRSQRRPTHHGPTLARFRRAPSPPGQTFKPGAGRAVCQPCSMRGAWPAVQGRHRSARPLHGALYASHAPHQLDRRVSGQGLRVEIVGWHELPQ